MAFLLLLAMNCQHLKVCLFAKLFQPLVCSGHDLADGLSDYPLLVMLLTVAEVTWFKQINCSFSRRLQIYIHNIFMTVWIKEYLYPIAITIVIIKMKLNSGTKALPQEYKAVSKKAQQIYPTIQGVLSKLSSSADFRVGI